MERFFGFEEDLEYDYYFSNLGTVSKYFGINFCQIYIIILIYLIVLIVFIIVSILCRLSR